MQPRRRKIVVLATTACALIGAIGVVIAGILMIGQQQPTAAQTPPPATSWVAQVETVTPPPQPVQALISVDPRAEVLNWEYLYTRCDHAVCREEPFEFSVNEQTRTALQELYPQAQIIDFEPGSILLRVTIDQYCPEHLILLWREDMLGIYQTQVGTDTLVLLRQLPMPHNMPQWFLDECSLGKAFESYEAIEHTLEDVIS